MNRIKRAVSSAVLVGLSGLALSCTEQPTGTSNQATPQFALLPNGAQVVKGSIGPGALYGLYLPQNWNGDLVLYAHGFATHAGALFQMRDVPQASCANPARTGIACNSEVRDSLLAMGYGFAWSSWSENGMAIKDGEIRTSQLIGLFSDAFGHPKRVYLWSHSMGGAVIMHMVETNPQRFAGALPVCGIIGGMPYQLNHYYSVRVLFDYYFPGVIPGSPLVSAGMDAAAVNAAIDAAPAAAWDLGSVDQVDLQYPTFAELKQAITWPLTFQTADWFGGETMLHTHGRSFFDNAGVTYTGSSDDAALNSGVARFHATPDAMNMVRQWYDPTGDLRVPVLALNMTRDPIVPFHHQAAYAALAASQGTSDLFVGRAIDRFGHCVSTVPEELNAFRDLFNWVENGSHP